MLLHVDRRIEPVDRRVRVVHGGRVVAESSAALVAIEPRWTAYYVPRADVLVALEATSTSTVCGWKGTASYWSVDGTPDVGWSYDDPLPEAAALRDHVAFHPSRVDELWVGDERIT